MFNPAKFALKNNRTTLVVYTIFMVLGLKVFLTIGRLEYPEFTIRNAQIITSYPGRTTVQVEQEVTEPIEQKIRQMPEIKDIKSTSKPGISIISVDLHEKYFDLNPIWQDMRNIVDTVTLPDGAKKPNIDDDVGDVFPYVYALRGDGYSYSELLEYAKDIRDELLALEGVAKVVFHGAQEERIYLEFSSSELAAYSLSPSQISSQLNSQNAVTASGNAIVGQERLNIITLGEFETIEELANFRLAISGEATSIRVSDLANIVRSYKEPAKSFSHLNGERVLCIAVSMIKGGVVTKIGERINSHLNSVKNRLPWGLDIETMFYQPEYVNKSIYNFIVNLGQAFFFVILVMFLFAGYRIAIIVGILVPSAVMSTFALMPTLNVQLEMMSIAALIIALGLLVDNAVVVSEQILVRLSNGDDRMTAVSDAVKGLIVPLLAASATTIAAFSPIALAPGATSEFTYSLFAVVTLTLLSSWVLSLTIIPLCCYYFLKPLRRDTWMGRTLTKCYTPYEILLRKMIQLRWGYPIVILLFTFVAAWGFKFVPSIFFPPNERGQFIVDFELPIGTDILETEKQVNQLEQWLLTEQSNKIRNVSSWIGNGGPRWYLSLASEPANPNYSLLSILTHSVKPDDVKDLIEKIHRYADTNFAAARVTAKALENGPPVGDPIQIRLYGRDMKTLYSLRDKIVREIKPVVGMFDVRDDWGAWVKQISVDPDPVKTARLGLTTESIASALNIQFTGITSTNFREEDKVIPVIIRSSEDFRQMPERLPDMPVFGSQVGIVPLSQVADISIEFLPSSILRENTLRVMTIKGRVRGRFADEALKDIQPLLANITESTDWPENYHIEYGGEQEESGESQSKIGSAMPISMSILAFILIAQFNSIRRFAIIALTIPPMLIGVTPGLLVTGSSFGFMTLLGLIALLGIIVNNAILLIDEINNQLKLELELVEAIVTAAKSRLRPILMTTITTIIGLGPLALGGGGMWSSMAYAMMFGLGFATLLTLILCPVLFYLFFRRSYKA